MPRWYEMKNFADKNSPQISRSNVSANVASNAGF